MDQLVGARAEAALVTMMLDATREAFPFLLQLAEEVVDVIPKKMSRSTFRGALDYVRDKGVNWVELSDEHRRELDLWSERTGEAIRNRWGMRRRFGRAAWSPDPTVSPDDRPQGAAIAINTLIVIVRNTAWIRRRLDPQKPLAAVGQAKTLRDLRVQAAEQWNKRRSMGQATWSDEPAFEQSWKELEQLLRREFWQSGIWVAHGASPQIAQHVLEHHWTPTQPKPLQVCFGREVTQVAWDALDASERQLPLSALVGAYERAQKWDLDWNDPLERAIAQHAYGEKAALVEDLLAADPARRHR